MAARVAAAQKGATEADAGPHRRLYTPTPPPPPIIIITLSIERSVKKSRSNKVSASLRETVIV